MRQGGGRLHAAPCSAFQGHYGRRVKQQESWATFIQGSERLLQLIQLGMSPSDTTSEERSIRPISPDDRRRGLDMTGYPRRIRPVLANSIAVLAMLILACSGASTPSPSNTCL